MSEQPPIEPPDDEETTPVEEPAHELGTTPPPPTGGDKIEPIDLNTEMQRSYIDYAMAVIVSRALPDVRDGLKPVHRRGLPARSRLQQVQPGRRRRHGAIPPPR